MTLNHTELKSSSAGLAIGKMCLNLSPIVEPTQNRLFHEVWKPLLYYEWKKPPFFSNTPSSYRTYMILIYADGGKYLSILLWKQMLRLCDRGPFCSCDFPTKNWNCDKLPGRILSEKPPISIFFSLPSSKTKLHRLGLFGWDSAQLLIFLWLLHGFCTCVFHSHSLRALRRDGGVCPSAVQLLNAWTVPYYLTRRLANIKILIQSSMLCIAKPFSASAPWICNAACSWEENCCQRKGRWARRASCQSRLACTAGGQETVSTAGLKSVLRSRALLKACQSLWRGC